MKKFFSLIALVGVFAACQPEDLRTAFSAANATADVAVTVVCAADGFTQGAAAITYAWSNGASTQAIEGNPYLNAGTVTVTATYNGATASETVSFPRLLAGSQTHLTATVMLPYNAGGYEIKAEPVEPAAEETELYVLKASLSHGTAEKYSVEYEGKTYSVPMVENATDMILSDSYSYKSFAGFEIAEDLKVTNNDFEDGCKVVFDAATAAAGITEKDETLKFDVSAWSLYNVINPVVTTTTTYNLVATPAAGSNNPTLPNGGVVGTFKLAKKSSAAGAVERAHPDHASHYEEGHGTGHGHGSNNNAGGGIVEAE